MGAGERREHGVIGLRISFDLGRYHATPWGANVNEGAVEWPPSPWRVMRALYSAGRTYAENRPDVEELDEVLERLMAAGPPHYGLPPSIEASTRHFVPTAKGDRTALLVDGFRRLGSSAELVIGWPGVELTERQREVLARASAAVGHLGRSESVCTARLDDVDPAEMSTRPLTATDRDPSLTVTRLLCPEENAPVSTLAVSVTELRAERRAAPAATRFRSFAIDSPITSQPALADAAFLPPDLATFRLAGGDRPGLSELIRMTATLRTETQRAFGRLREHGASLTLSGHDDDGRPRRDQHQHAHWLAWSDPGSSRVDRLGVWAPEGLSEDEVQALAAVRRLKAHGIDALRVGLTALGSTEDLELPPLIAHGATRWRSVTPVILGRHPKRRGGIMRDTPEEQIVRELEHRGFGEPRAVARLGRAWHEFRQQRPGQDRFTVRPALGFTIDLAQPARGPLVLGALAHFGLGLFAPVLGVGGR